MRTYNGDKILVESRITDWSDSGASGYVISTSNMIRTSTVNPGPRCWSSSAMSIA